MKAKGKAGKHQDQPKSETPLKWQPGRGGGDISALAGLFKDKLKGRKIDIKKALADHARARYAKWQRG